MAVDCPLPHGLVFYSPALAIPSSARGKAMLIAPGSPMAILSNSLVPFAIPSFGTSLAEDTYQPESAKVPAWREPLVACVLPGQTGCPLGGELTRVDSCEPAVPLGVARYPAMQSLLPTLYSRRPDDGP